jgi:hypothetical protein
MYTAPERFSDAAALLSSIESRTVREGRRAFAWQMAEKARRTRRERIISVCATAVAAAAWVACVILTSGMFFVVGTDF